MFTLKMLFESNSPKDLALLTSDSGDSKDAILYSPRELFSNVREYFSSVNVDDGEDVDPDKLGEICLDSIKGFVRIMKPKHNNECNGAWEVKLIAGPGYGKQIYGAAYAMSPTKKLIPDRSSVSQDARKAWSGVAAKGKAKIEPLDDYKKKKTPPTSDDCETWAATDDANADVLDNSFQDGSTMSEFDLYKDNHEKAIEQLDSVAQVVGLNGRYVMRQLSQFGLTFFRANYKPSLSELCSSHFVSSRISSLNRRASTYFDSFWGSSRRNLKSCT
jgi:hypothetical protein